MMLTKLNIRGVLPPRVTKYLSTTSIIHQDQRHTNSRKIRIKNDDKNRESEQKPVRPRQRDIGPGNNNHRYYRMTEQEGKRIIEIRIPHQLKFILVIFFNPLSLIFYLMVYEAGPKELFDAISEEYQDWKDKK